MQASLLEACMDYGGMSWRCENNCYSYNDEMWTGWTKLTEHQHKPENATALWHLMALPAYMDQRLQTLLA